MTEQEQTVNLGRALTVLGLEDRLLKALPNRPINERPHLAKGIIDGLLERGAWQDAVQLVYSNPINILLGSDEDFKKSVFKCLDQREKVLIYDSTKELLYKHWSQEDLCKLATYPLYNEEKDAMSIARSLDNENKIKVYNLLGERALQRNDFEAAYKFFNSAENKEEIDKLYKKTIKNITKSNISLLIDLAEDAPEQRDSRLSEIIQSTLKNSKLKKYLANGGGERLYSLCKKYNLQLSKENNNKLLNFAAKTLSSWQIKQENNDVKLKWALEHAKKTPALAYKILKQQKYKGPEVLTAALQGILNIGADDSEDHCLYIRDVEKKDLQAIYKNTSKRIQARIAMHLNKKKDMLKLSKWFYQNKKKSDKHLLTAYELWIKGGGAQDASYVNNLRKILIKQKTKDTIISTWWLENSDITGHIQMYNAIFKKFPEDAYELACKINNEVLMQQSRELMINESPKSALSKFTGSYGKSKDYTGIELVISTIAKNYSVEKEELEQFIQQKLKDESK